ncbi:helix-turn-helix domain-containing protein [Neolewinella antarctica]|uniref:Transcriptional regulator with XRE-family HTH domain n=1 Tax=Neolewinella antarctica TaxID=442734 RepID=A0ABX0XCQ5_9BACT|nr:helix-turn-helix transcriptional regulator [Neolewinella antarctica]NJC27045.1 transcriptional regulator with XRE-family HTH domain [Neolewinella antarctica]
MNSRSKYSVQKLPADVLSETATKVKILRKQRKYSQAELAERSGVSLGSLRRFEQTGHIAFESLLKISLILGRLTDFEGVLDAPTDLKKIERLFDKKLPE